MDKPTQLNSYFSEVTNKQALVNKYAYLAKCDYVSDVTIDTLQKAIYSGEFGCYLKRIAPDEFEKAYENYLSEQQLDKSPIRFTQKAIFSHKVLCESSSMYKVAITHKSKRFHLKEFKTKAQAQGYALQCLNGLVELVYFQPPFIDNSTLSVLSPKDRTVWAEHYG